MRAAIFLAAEYGSGKLRTRREVSEAMALPPTFVPQVMSDLVRAGLVVSAPGLGGGYRLARPPELVTLVDVVEAGEGPLDGSASSGGCAARAVLSLDALWNEASARVRHALAGMTLAQLVGHGEEGARIVGRPPCGVMADRAPSSSVPVRAGDFGPKEVRKEAVEGRRDLVGATARPRRRDGRCREEHAVDEDDEQ